MQKTTQFVIIALLLIIIGALLVMIIVEEPDASDSQLQPAPTEQPTLPLTDGESTTTNGSNSETSPPLQSDGIEAESADNEEGENNTLTKIETLTPSLVGVRWRWQRTEGPGDSFLTNLPVKNPFVLTFNNETYVTSVTDCNSIGGSYKTEGNSLLFFDMFSTMMECEDSLEGEYQSQLRKVERFEIIGKTLNLFMKDEKGVMVFRVVE